MGGRLAVFMVLLLVLLNLGGLTALVLDLGRGRSGAAVGTLLVTVLLDLVGFWMLRRLRDEG